MLQPLILAALFVTGQAVSHADDDAAPPGWQRIDGRTQPERLPQSLVWESAFRTVLVLATDEAGGYSDEKIAALSKYSLYIKPAQVRMVLEVADRTLKRVDDVRRPLNEEHSSGKSLGWPLEQRLKALETAEAEVMRGKLQLQSQLPPQAFRAVERWVAIGSFGTIGYVREQ